MIFPADAFLHHVGLDAFPTSPTQEEALGSNRAHITTCLTHILAVMKRSCVPKNIQVSRFLPLQSQVQRFPGIFEPP